ncbi:MAG: hypothetical protein J5726_08415 [Treponema sp.]|nr:hypothetical protein [Treponema sp.]
MKNRKFSLIFLFLTMLSSTTLFAEESKLDKFLEALFPWPILSLESGYPEFFSADVGVETLFIPIGNETRAGTYVCYSYARSKYDNFHRFSVGLACGMMGLFDAHGGVGCGLMPKNHEVLHTVFGEFSARMFLLEVKTIYETPLKPSGLKEYYNNRYTEGFKFKIGLSI